MRKSRAEYEKYLKSAKWKSIRKRVLARAGGVCECCGKPAKQIDVHHLTYERFGGDELLEDLQALCRNYCHRIEHNLFPIRLEDGSVELRKNYKRPLPARNAKEQSAKWKRANKKTARKYAKRVGVAGRPWHYNADIDYELAPARQVPLEEWSGFLPGKKR